MIFGLTAPEYDFMIENLVKPLNAVSCDVYIFGSRANLKHKKYSDIDVMIESDKRVDVLVSEILEYFSKSNFPYKIDLVQLEDFSDTYIENYQKEKVLIKHSL